MKYLSYNLAPLMANKRFRHFITTKGITVVLCFFIVREFASQLKMSVIEQITKIRF